MHQRSLDLAHQYLAVKAAAHRYLHLNAVRIEDPTPVQHR